MPRARGLWGSLGFFMLYWSSFDALCLLIKINISRRPIEESSPCPSSGLVNGKKDLGAGSGQKATRSPERHQVMAHFLRNFHSLFVKTQVLVSVNWQIPTLFVPGFMLLLLQRPFHSLCILSPWSSPLIFLVSSGMHLKECLLALSSISNCSAVGSLQVILSSVLPEVKSLKSDVKGTERDQQWMCFLTFSRKCQTPWSPKSRSLRQGKFL